MNTRNTLILLVILAALATYAYFGEIQKGTGQGTETPGSQPAVFNLSGRMSSPEGDHGRRQKSVELKREAGKPWTMVAPASQAVDDTRVNSLVDQLAQLTASRALTQTNNLAEYGLITGTLTANITLTGGVTHTLLVGETNPSGNSYYALADSKADACLPDLQQQHRRASAPRDAAALPADAGAHHLAFAPPSRYCRPSQRRQR